MIITFDIETLPCSDQEVIESLAATIQPPAQYKKQESIEAWMADNKEQALKELVSKTALDSLYGSIACISYAFDDGDPHSVHTVGNTEFEMLEQFYIHLSQMADVVYQGGVTSHLIIFSGHNLAGFDLPFLKHRSIIKGINPPASLRKAMNAKPWDSCIADTMLMWDSNKRVSMAKLCKALGIEGKGDIDGSMVAEVWKTDPHKVIRYCEGDVIRTRQIYKRLTFQS